MENVKKNVIYFCVSVISVFLLCFFVLIVSVRDNPLHNRVRFNIFYFLPQGWSFFTKETGKYHYTIYEKINNNFYEINTKNVAFKNYFGFNKSNRILPSVIDNNLNKINKNLWYKSTKNIQKVTLDSLNSIKISDDLSLSKGEYFLQLTEIKPWYYFANDITYNSDFYYLKINVK